MYGKFECQKIISSIVCLHNTMHLGFTVLFTNRQVTFSGRIWCQNVTVYMGITLPKSYNLVFSLSDAVNLEFTVKFTGRKVTFYGWYTVSESYNLLFGLREAVNLEFAEAL